MKKVINIIDRLVIAIILPALILTVASAIILPLSGSEAYYRQHFQSEEALSSLSHSFYDNDGNLHEMKYTAEELNEIIHSIIGYLLGSLDSMQVEVKRDDISYEVFSVQALKHMADVRVLYKGGIKIAIASAIILVFCIVYCIIRRKSIVKKWGKTSLVVAIILLIIIACVGVYCILNWDEAFVIFHKIIFPHPDKFADAFFSRTSNYQEKYYIDNLFLIKLLTADLFSTAGLLAALAVMTAIIIYVIVTIKISKKGKEK